MAKPKIATASLAGCFGCHMSLLDIDERLLELIQLVEFDKSPIDDKKEFDGRVEVGLIEGGCCNEENVRGSQGFSRALRRAYLDRGLCHDGWNSRRCGTTFRFPSVSTRPIGRG